MDSVKASVIVPVYNAENYLAECLDSIVGQTLREIEIICVDDGSTDSSLEILEERADQDGRIKVLRQENKGAGPARNKGMAAATGKYVAFMDSDDLYPERDTLEKLVEAAETHACKAAGGYKQAMRDGRIYDVDWDKVYKVIKKNPNGRLTRYSELQTDFNYYCYIFDREMLARGNIAFPDYRRFQDPPFFVSAMHAAETVYLVPCPTYVYRRGHQEIAWDARRVNDLIRGNIDVLALAQEYGLQTLYADVSKRLAREYATILFQDYSLENTESYLLLVKLSAIRDPASGAGAPELKKILTKAERELAALLATQCEKGGNWLGSFLARAKDVYLARMDSNGETTIARSLLRVLRALFAPSTTHQARVMLRECLSSPEYRALGLEAHADGERKTVEALHGVEPAFAFAEELKKKREGVPCRVVHDCAADRPKFSVIIPVYNVAPYLAACLDSVVNQTLSGVEIICVDDGSTDESFAILMEYAQKYGNIKILREANSGLSVARNQGLKAAKGEYIHFLDGDDLVKPETYETLYALMTLHDLDMVQFNADVLYENEELERKHSQHKARYSHNDDIERLQSGAEYYVRAVRNNTFAVGACMFSVRKSVLDRGQIAFVPGVFHEDEFFMNACLLLSKKFMHVAHKFYCYRIREHSLTTQDKEFRHSYGCFANYCALCEFLSERKLDIDVRSAVAKRADTLLSLGYAAYKNIKDDRQRYYYLALPPEEGVLFKQLFYDRYIVDNRSSTAAKNLKASLAREAALKKSVSFRVGRAVTWFPRKARGGARCLKEHGPVYTAKRFFWHIARLKGSA